MKWKKLGHVFTPENNFSWMRTHAANTVAEHLENDTFRIYFSTRDTNRRSSIGSIILDVNENGAKNIRVETEPILSPGSIGLFDDSGVSLSCIINIENKKLLFYLGWNLGVTVPWRNSIGLATSEKDSLNFKRQGLAPLMDRSNVDPYSISYPFVLKDQGLYRMWYGSNLSWGSEQKDMKHVIKYAESPDGFTWNRTGDISLNFSHVSEYAMSRPFVIKENEVYRMWYSYRGLSYRIGYAESKNGIHFERLDHLVGIEPSSEGWDSESVEYPFLFDHKGRRYMLYNGNGYGATGFGLAILER